MKILDYPTCAGWWWARYSSFDCPKGPWMVVEVYAIGEGFRAAGYDTDDFDGWVGPLQRPDTTTPAPDVQAQDKRPPCNCPRDYARYFGDDPHNRWCPRSRNPHPEVIQAQIDAAYQRGLAIGEHDALLAKQAELDAAVAQEREECAKWLETLASIHNKWTWEHAYRHAAMQIRARSGAKGV